jgi:hypothetical protein
MDGAMPCVRLQFKFLETPATAIFLSKKSMKCEAFNQQFSTIRWMVPFPGGTSRDHLSWYICNQIS